MILICLTFLSDICLDVFDLVQSAVYHYTSTSQLDVAHLDCKQLSGQDGNNNCYTQPAQQLPTSEINRDRYHSNSQVLQDGESFREKVTEVGSMLSMETVEVESSTCSYEEDDLKVKACQERNFPKRKNSLYVGRTGEEESAKQRASSPQLWTDNGTTYHAPKGPSRHSVTSERPNVGTGLGLPPLLRIALSGWQTAAEIFDLRLDVNAQGSLRNLQGTMFSSSMVLSVYCVPMDVHACVVHVVNSASEPLWV
ncbi:unnamed protein product [Sphagnum jensenii]|uniref:Uncharacterized protein n=1 Tax=Sphagnum jensenii TaxID=128206 RepID=A0ABP0W2Q1_9BRYO